MESINTKFRISELAEPHIKRNSKSKIPVKTQFQQMLEKECRDIAGRAKNGYLK